MNYMNTKLIIFDLDGTIIDSIHLWQTIDEAFFESLGLDMPKDYQQKIASMPFKEAARYTKNTFPIAMTEAEMVQTWMDMAYDLYAYHIPFLDNGIEEYLEQLFQKGYSMVIATSCDPQLLTPCLKRLGIDHYFSRIYTTARCPYLKTDPRFYQEILMDFNIKGKEALFYDDIKANLDAAKTLGILTVIVNSEYIFTKNQNYQ